MPLIVFAQMQFIKLHTSLSLQLKNGHISKSIPPLIQTPPEIWPNLQMFILPMEPDPWTNHSQ